MGIKKIHHGKVRKGKFIPHDIPSFKLAFAKLEGKDVEVTVAQRKKHRSNEQNSYYWGVVIELISAETGFTPQEAHDAMRVKFLSDMSGDMPRIRSTTELTTVEFMDYIAQIQQFASEFLGIFIPDPDSVEW